MSENIRIFKNRKRFKFFIFGAVEMKTTTAAGKAKKVRITNKLVGY